MVVVERELAALRDEVRALRARAAEDAADIARLRAELGAARDRIAVLERDPEVRQVAGFKKRLAESEAARAASERAASIAVRDAQLADEQLESLREAIRDAREQLTATAVAHAVATDEVATLRRQAQVVKAQSTTALLTATAQLETRISELTELGARATARAAQAEAMLRAAEARGQHTDASLEQAIARAKAAEARAAYLDERVSVHGVLARQADEEYALARNQIVALETRLAALEASGSQIVESSTKRASEHAAELMVAVAGEIASVEPPSTDATKRATRIAAALADQQIREAARRVDDADTRANASETIAKAMAKDVAEALRRAADVELRLRHGAVELEAAHRRAERAEAEHAYTAGTIAEIERRAAEAEARASQAEAELQLATAEVRRVGSAGQAALDQIRRELAAERSTGTALTDCKHELERDLAELRAQLSTAITRAGAAEHRNVELEREVETADNVRSFAAETEREIAQLQRQLQDARSAIAELAIERDRLVAAEHDARTERAPTNPLGEVTAQYNMTGLEELVRRTAGLEDRVVELERDNAQLRDQLARAKRRAR